MIRRIVLAVILFFCMNSFVFAKSLFSPKKNTSQSQLPSDLDQYIQYFHKVYDVIESNYYVKLNPEQLETFITKFKTKIYPQLVAEGKSSDYVKWRSAWYLVDSLKTTDDKFTQFYPPKPAEKFQHEALGQRVDLGIEGKKNDQGFVVTRIEPRADPYVQGLREEDVIQSIDGKSIVPLSEDDINKLLNPVINTKVALVYQAASDNHVQTITVQSKEYFKQTVFSYPVAVPGIFCLEIPKFNRTTGEDLYRFLHLIQQQHPEGLILDLRGNPGGPPLAAREISSFFLKGGEEFAYFQRRDQEKSDLDVPVIDEQLKFNGPMVVLVNEESGSAAELFAGIMQFRGRALVLGVTTAGQVLLKSMFPIDDGAMVAMVTSMGYYPNGKTFGFVGVTPDKTIINAPKDGLINLAASLIKASQQQHQ